MYEIFRNFNLKVQIECLDYGTNELANFILGDFFNLEGDYIAGNISFFVKDFVVDGKMLFL